MTIHSVPYRVLIVDDEPLARETLRTLIGADPELQLVGECRDGEEAVSAIAELAPDLVALDVQMPGLDGFEVVHAIGDEMPEVIFVTAFDEFALKAFDVHAVDYVVKPFDDDRFRLAIERTKQRLRAGTSEQWRSRVARLAHAPRKEPISRLVVRQDNRVLLVPVREILWFEADGYNVRVHVERLSYTIRHALRDLEGQLDRRRFFRTHRSAIVNLDHVKELQPLFHGEFILVLRNGAQVPLSAARRRALEAQLDQRL